MLLPRPHSETQHDSVVEEVIFLNPDLDLPSLANMNINVSPNPLGTVYATKRRRRSNKR